MVVFRVTVGVTCGHSQLLQYLKWFDNSQGENAEFKIKGKHRRREAAYAEMGKVLFLIRAGLCFLARPGGPLDLRAA